MKQKENARLSGIKAILEALETDICDGLIDLRQRGYSVRHAEVMDALNRAKLSRKMAMAFAAHVLLRFDDARRVIENTKKLEPIIKRKLEIDRKNRNSSHQPRKRKGGDLRAEIIAIMAKEKRRGVAFKDFIDHATKGHIEGLTIKKMHGGKHKLYTENVAVSEALILKENSIRRMFSSPKK